MAIQAQPQGTKPFVTEFSYNFGFETDWLTSDKWTALIGAAAPDAMLRLWADAVLRAMTSSNVGDDGSVTISELLAAFPSFTADIGVEGETQSPDPFPIGIDSLGGVPEIALTKPAEGSLKPIGAADAEIIAEFYRGGAILDTTVPVPGSGEDVNAGHTDEGLAPTTRGLDTAEDPAPTARLAAAAPSDASSAQPLASPAPADGDIDAASDTSGDSAAPLMASGVAAASTTPVILEKRIASSADDVEQRSSGSMSFTSSDLELTVDGSTQQTVGMRFTGLDIPKGAVITNAYIQFTVDAVTTGAAQLRIRGEDADDAAAFTSAAFNASSRPLTDALVDWAPAGWSTRNAAGADQRTPDLTQIVQEIVGRPGWAASNDMVFLVTGTGTRNAHAFDGTASGAPLLHVEYYVPDGGGGGSPVVFQSPADANSNPDQIAELAAAGTLVGITAAAADPDAGDTVSYSISDGRFAIDAATGVVTRSGTGTLNAQSEPSVAFEVTATSSDGSTATQDYTVNVTSQGSQVLFRYAVFGDFGDTEPSGEQAVADLVRSWNVDFILTVGDNAYGSIPFDDAVGKFYSDYIGNYKGSYGSGSALNRFFPTLGNHEYEDSSAGPNGSISTYLDYFTLPDNERYYDFQVGSVHFFGLNSNSQEPDGRTSSSVQAQWLESALAESDANFNVAYFHHTPYSSGGGTSSMRWNFEGWGADAVFAGHVHDYDRVMRDDNGDGVSLPYITTGLGGAGNRPPNVGASLVTVTDAGMLIEFYTVDGVRQDSVFINAPAGGNPLFGNGNDIMNGTANADYLWGLRGNDTLIGRRGNDMLIGGDGNDMFVFNVGDGQDIIADFVAGAGTDDVLDLRAFGIDSAAKFREFAINSDLDVVVDLGGGQRITLLAVQEEQFQDNDFRSDPLLA